MTTMVRRFFGLAGGIILGTALGDAADKAGITPNNDGDMAVYGIVAGLGFGLTVLALVGDER